MNQPVIEKTGFGKIVWKGSGLNVSGADFDSYSSISSNSVSVNSANLNPDLNTPANITLYNLNYQHDPVIYKDGALCNNFCSFISYSSGTLKFNV